MKNYHSAASCFLQELNLSLKLYHFFQLEEYLETFTKKKKKCKWQGATANLCNEKDGS